MRIEHSVNIVIQENFLLTLVSASCVQQEQLQHLKGSVLVSNVVREWKQTLTVQSVNFVNQDFFHLVILNVNHVPLEVSQVIKGQLFAVHALQVTNQIVYWDPRIALNARLEHILLMVYGAKTAQLELYQLSMVLQNARPALVEVNPMHMEPFANFAIQDTILLTTVNANHAHKDLFP